MATLLTLPLELLVAVSTHLSTPDLGSLRLTCKLAETSLYEWFSGEFFSKKQFMLTHPSLQALVDISKHPGFCKTLQHVIIATNVYNPDPRPFRDKKSADLYTQGYMAQKTLMATGIDRDMLTEAFQNLVNLHTVGIRDYHATSRLRDGQSASWASWGATTVWKDTGVHMSFANRNTYRPENNSPFLTRVFPTVNYALGMAGRTPPSLEVILRKELLPDSTFDVPDFLLPTIEHVLRGYASLLLSVSLAAENPHTQFRQNTVENHHGRSLRRFLGYTPNLTHLRLNFHIDETEDNANFLVWLGQSAPMPTPESNNYLSPHPISLPLLTTLDLGKVRILDDNLVAIVTKFASTLGSLNLWKVGLYSDSNPGLPQGNKPNFWAELLLRIIDIPQLDLEHIKLGLVRQDYLDRVSMRVGFQSEEDGHTTVLEKVEYKGKDWKTFLRGLMVNLVRPYQYPVRDELASEADSENEDDFAAGHF
ncbi:hypothetical protein IAQ61_005155 [Plenodomus lingam]|uniref:F-box domain-containing protein n=1 Tax=Leptosphaeria maculans (strain JN3 / isolate v23.1.3 / race Av1-4-5-6-7-8) TaxID=985895 RepID=E5A7J6_LEPMJ|nr:hypothetical protein LEMA_P088300.1 [Plenodomus lingam JN3]KAH9872320.1 hypothetical protein IAQ61_005155 [Plenodomus lingam]CBX99591.1 hypothetical protein LEMA_P088300.1 [Plenodomus lingam JN3]